MCTCLLSSAFWECLYVERGSWAKHQFTVTDTIRNVSYSYSGAMHYPYFNKDTSLINLLGRQRLGTQLHVDRVVYKPTPETRTPH